MITSRLIHINILRKKTLPCCTVSFSTATSINAFSVREKNILAQFLILCLDYFGWKIIQLKLFIPSVKTQSQFTQVFPECYGRSFFLLLQGLHRHPRNEFWRNFPGTNYFELKSSQQSVHSRLEWNWFEQFGLNSQVWIIQGWIIFQPVGLFTMM